MQPWIARPIALPITRAPLARAILLTATALAAAPACSGTEPEPLPTAAPPITEGLEQHADGCGANRYRGTANIDCRYEARLDYTIPINARGTCVGDSQIRCTYDFTCFFRIAQVITTCVDSAASQATCWSSYPPEGSPPTPQTVYTFELSTGSTLCDPPGTAQQLAQYCAVQRDAPVNNADDACRDGSDRNTGSTTCCLDCPQLPDGGPQSCGGDAGPPGLDAGIRLDAGVSDARSTFDAGAPFDAGAAFDARTRLPVQLP